MKNTNILILCILLIIILTIYLVNINYNLDNFIDYTYDKDCDSFNDKSSKIKNRENECEYYGCKWINTCGDNGKCVSNIFEGCAQKTSKNECINPLTNFDTKLNKNKCKWVIDQNSKSESGFCIDSNIPTPCSKYTADNCPTDNRYDILGNFIEVSHCSKNKITNKCVTNYEHPKVKAITDIDGCNFYNLDGKTKKLTKANCVEINLGNGAKKMISPNRLSCLNEHDKDNCTGECEFDKGGFCKTRNLELANTFDPVNEKMYDKDLFKETENKLKEITSYSDANKDKYIKDTIPINGIGVIGELYDVDNQVSIKKILLKDCSKEMNMLNLEDSIIIHTFDNDKDKEIYGKIIGLNELEKEILIEYNYIRGKLNNTTLKEKDSIMWSVKNPILGLFSSYQFSNALIDAAKLKNIYN